MCTLCTLSVIPRSTDRTVRHHPQKISSANHEKSVSGETLPVGLYRLSAIKCRGYYLFHHAIYCGYYLRAATNRRRRLLNSKRGNGLEHRVCTKKKFLFQPWAVWYCHNHPNKTGRKRQSHYCHEGFRWSHVARPPCLDLRKCQALRQLSGNMTNNRFSSLHAHSEIVTVLKGLTKRFDRLPTVRILATATTRG